MSDEQTEHEGGDLVAEIRALLNDLGADTESLVMTSYESVDDGVHCYHFELLSLDGLRAGYFTNKDEIPKDEEELLETILELEIETWDTLEVEELIELRDYLKSELSEPPEESDEA